jgi:hypothetical protein
MLIGVAALGPRCSTTLLPNHVFRSLQSKGSRPELTLLRSGSLAHRSGRPPDWHACWRAIASSFACAARCGHCVAEAGVLPIMGRSSASTSVCRRAPWAFLGLEAPEGLAAWPPGDLRFPGGMNWPTRETRRALAEVGFHCGSPNRCVAPRARGVHGEARIPKSAPEAHTAACSRRSRGPGRRGGFGPVRARPALWSSDLYKR